jgi:serine/threonine protein kinase
MKFQKVEEIGQGGFGKVYKIVEKKNTRAFAVKVVRMYIKAQDSLNEVYKHHVYREV